MQSVYREPQVEEGLRNIILQNRCGNRLTLLCHEGDSQLELVYKPNAFRRKELAARNFSDRDNVTALFRDLRLPDWPAASYQHFDYDAFHTQCHCALEGGARQRFDLINIADQNCFAICARQPLLLVIRPHASFEVANGLLLEAFADRGEEIVSFVAFGDMVANRYRVLDDGSHVLQLIEDDVLLIGGEENRYQVDRLLRAVRGLDREALLARNERCLAKDLGNARLHCADDQLQRVIDVNRRVVWSGLDAGGACFGALNRIYHLIWVRDGSMTSNYMALAGDQQSSRIWAPFLLANPSRLRQDDGSWREEFVQIVGSRWTKTEDDGLFYAAWTAYTHFRCTGDDSLVNGEALPLLLRCCEHQFAKCWDDDRGLMGSDTLGEDLLAGSTYFGYDTVNGKPTASHHHGHDKTIERCWSLYHQVNSYNVWRMLAVLLRQRPELDNGLAARFAARCERLRMSLREHFVDQHGQLMSLILRYDDGSEEAKPWGKGVDYWEHAWAVSQGPFFPLPALQLTSARQVVATWGDLKPYGYCPWNVLARSLAEHGLASHDWRDMLADEISEALHCPQKYPMAGALTEYHGATESWRGLPFSAGSFINSAAAQLLQSQAQGLAVRGGRNLTAIDDFRYRLSRIAVQASGEAEGVAQWTLNGRAFIATLQVPENGLLPGANVLHIERGAPTKACRLHGSDAELLDWQENGDTAQGTLRSAVPMQIRIQGDASQATVLDADGQAIACEQEPLPDTDLTVLHVPAGLIRLQL